MALNIQISGPKMIMHNKTIAEMFADQLNNNEGLFGIDCSTGKEYSFPKLKKDVSAMATVFKKHDLGPGDVVMIADHGSYEGHVVLLAGLLVRTTVGALDHGLKKNVLARIIDQSKPSVLFCNTSSTNIITDILNIVEHQPILKISTMIRDGFTDYSSIIVAMDETSIVRPTEPKSPIGPCVIIYSSGTTGGSKGIYLSEDAIKSALIISFKRSFMEEPIETRFMSNTPLFWYSGMLYMMIGIHFGKPRLFFSEKSTAEQVLCSIDKFNPTYLKTDVATVIDMMDCQMANGHKYNIQSLKAYVVAGSPMRADLQRTIVNNLFRGKIPIKQVYGSTEQGPVTGWSMGSDISTVIEGSVGRPSPGIKIKIVSLKTGECVGPNTEGEIRSKSNTAKTLTPTYSYRMLTTEWKTTRDCGVALYLLTTYLDLRSVN